MSRQSVIFAIGTSVVLALNAWHLWYVRRRGELLPDDNGGDPYEVTRVDIAVSAALALGLAVYAAYGLRELCIWTGRYLRCE